MKETLQGEVKKFSWGYTVLYRRKLRTDAATFLRSRKWRDGERVTVTVESQRKRKGRKP